MAGENELEEIVYELNQGSVSRRPANGDGLDRLLKAAVETRASDLILVDGCSPTLRVRGALVAAGTRTVSGQEIAELLAPVMNRARETELAAKRYIDFSFSRPSLGRFRINMHHQKGTLAASIRVLPARVPTPEELNLPKTLAKLVERKHGLILVTGPTGSGKTSTLAALIDMLNRQRRAHIVTIEDPIEYYHTNRQSIVEQIEVGHDTPSFAEAIRAVLRQNPEIILIGEMRDAETMAAALTASETGHLVLSTLHTNDSVQTISRILDSFPAIDQTQIRQQLSLALIAVIAQQLVPGTDGETLYPAVEVMVANLAIRNLIRMAKDHQIRSMVMTGRADGMVTMDQSLAELVRSRRITVETAMFFSHHPGELRGDLGGAPAV